MEIITEDDLNINFDNVNNKASSIEDWINNLALLNQTVNTDSFQDGLNISMFSDEGEQEDKDPKIDKQIHNIKQIANTCKLNSVQERNQFQKRRTYYE